MVTAEKTQLAPPNFKALADKIEEQHVRYPHTEEETQSLRQKLADSSINLSGITDELNEIKAEYKKKTDHEKRQIGETLKSLKAGYEEVKMQVYGVADHSRGIMEFYDEQGTLVSSRRLYPEERQFTLRANI